MTRCYEQLDTGAHHGEADRRYRQHGAVGRECSANSNTLKAMLTIGSMTR
jgi:hypothetical protein